MTSGKPKIITSIFPSINPLHTHVKDKILGTPLKDKQEGTGKRGVAGPLPGPSTVS